MIVFIIVLLFLAGFFMVGARTPVEVEDAGAALSPPSMSWVAVPEHE